MSERTCVACRRKAESHELIRLVADPSVDPETAGPPRVLIDAKARFPGRGTWVCPSKACIEKLSKKPAILQRALDLPVRCDGLAQLAVEHTDTELQYSFSLAMRSGSIVGGSQALSRLLPSGSFIALVVACDSSERARRNAIRLAPELPVFDLQVDSEELGRWIGTPSRVVLALRQGKPSDYLLRILRRRMALG